MKKLIFGLLSLTVILNPSLTLAEELVITGNGDGSSSTINVGSTNTTNVEQTNTANVENNVEVNANTGENEANENTGGDTNITTGDITSNVEIINAGINQSTATVGCCDNSNTNVTVSGNGSNSENSVGYSSNTGTNVSVNNNANIVNSITGKANTGNNSANENNGSVSIKTGDIKVVDTIINRSINISQVKALTGSNGSVNIKIDGNGADSENTVVVKDENKIQIAVNNQADIENKSEWDLNTGNNEANSNNGDVEIETGDIVYKTTIENNDVNVSIVDIDCCEDKGGPGPDDNPTPNVPGNNGGTGSSNGGGSSSNGQGGTTSSQPILPITGSPSLIVLALTVTLMFFLGWYLRLRSGRSPNLAI